MFIPVGCPAGSMMQKQYRMSHFHGRSLIFCSVPLLAFLAGCSAKPECDSFETRNAVLQAISDDHNNPLGNYAAQNSNVGKDDSSRAKPDAEASKNSERTRPLYRLGETIVTTSTSKDKRTLQCSGAISATVGDTNASKDVNFTVQQAPDGKISVSVAPFQF